MGTTVTLAEFGSQLRAADLPNDVRQKVTLHTLDQIGAELAGGTRWWNAIVRDYALDQSPSGASTVIGASRNATAEWAAFSNATAGHGFEMDDYHPGALSHPGCVTVPVVLAVGEAFDTRGDEALVALALGFESIVRLGLAVMPSMLYDRGFHETCTEGVFGATLAAGRLRDLDESTIASALGIAGSHASGTTEYTQSGGEVKRLHAGLGAVGGIRAVELASRGFTGPSTIIEGKRGFLQAFTNTYKEEAITGGLGDRWDLLGCAIKPYACCGFIHAPIDALQEITESEKITADDIEEVVVGCDRASLVHVGRIGPHPRDMTGVQFSMEYSLAMSLVLGGTDFSHFVAVEKSGFKIPEVDRLADRIRLELDAEADAAFPDKFFARIRLRRKDGSWIERSAYATGSPESPMSDERVREKFRGIARDVVGEKSAEAIERAVDDLANGGPVRAILSSITPGAAS